MRQINLICTADATIGLDPVFVQIEPRRTTRAVHDAIWAPA